MSRSGRARGKREEGTAEKTRADGGEDRRSGRRRRQERSAGKTGGAVGGEDRRSGRRGRRDETAKKRQKTTKNGRMRPDNP